MNDDTTGATETRIGFLFLRQFCDEPERGANLGDKNCMLAAWQRRPVTGRRVVAPSILQAQHRGLAEF